MPSPSVIPSRTAPSASDFSALKSTFGKAFGQVGYDRRVDFDNTDVVGSPDFALQKLNFGGAGPFISFALRVLAGAYADSTSFDATVESALSR